MVHRSLAKGQQGPIVGLFALGPLPVPAGATGLAFQTRAPVLTGQTAIAMTQG
jgi:hypothetical protein